MTKPKSNNFNETEMQIRKILWEDWDPIGCGVPSDEYDAYVPRIHELLEEGASIAYIAATLEHITTKIIGLKSNLGEDFKIATSLWKIYHQNQKEKND